MAPCQGGTTDGADAEVDTGEDGEAPTGKKGKEGRNYVKAVCQCTPAAVIRVSPKTLERRNIMCGDCMEPFRAAQTTGSAAIGAEIEKALD